MNSSNQEIDALSAQSPQAQPPEWIALALSGGGFRATVFHLGVVRALQECNLLERVKLICSVSGGSILAGHLMLHWDRYISGGKTFDETSQKIFDFVKRDISLRVFRRWLAGWIIVVPRLIRRCNPRKILQKEYDAFLYKRTSFEHLQGLTDRPEIHILATSLTTGALCKFSCNFNSANFEVTGTKPVPITRPTLSLAVTASSAYPVFFPAVPVNDKILDVPRKDFDEEHFLTDGGVFDNLGIKDLSEAVNQWQGPGLLIVSDASANFDYKRRKYSPVVSIPRNIRANDIMMRRLSDLEMAVNANETRRVCRIDTEELIPTQANGAPPLAVQRAVRAIATRLNACSDVEIDAVLRQGQTKAFDALKQLGLCSDKKPTWYPLGDQISKREDQPFQKLLRRSKWRRWARLAALDSATWVILIGLFCWIGGFWAIPHFNYQRKLQQQAQRYENAINLSKRVYVLQAIDASHKPVPGATVHIRLEDAAKSEYEGKTDAQGYYSFVWAPALEEFLAHITIEKQGIGTANKVFYIEAGPVQQIQLF